MKPSHVVCWLSLLPLLAACLEGDPNPYETGEGSAGSVASAGVGGSSVSNGGSSGSGGNSGSAGSASGGGSGTASGSCSLEAVTPVNITFTNNYGDRAVNLYWVDYGCGEVNYATIGPLSSFTQMTFVTHPWRLRDEITGALLLEFIAASAIPVTVSVP
jgi:hypothetical protein